MKIQTNYANDLLDKVELKKTPARIALLDLFLKNKKHLSAKDITLKLSKYKFDKVTVYRVLEAMTKKGLIHRVDTGNREAQYEIIDRHNDHHHVICINCKKVSDFTGCDANSLIANALKQVKDFKSITHHSFDLFGICNTCSKK